MLQCNTVSIFNCHLDLYLKKWDICKLCLFPLSLSLVLVSSLGLTAAAAAAADYVDAGRRKSVAISSCLGQCEKLLSVS